jgi:hypothetical protein
MSYVRSSLPSLWKCLCGFCSGIRAASLRRWSQTFSLSTNFIPASLGAPSGLGGLSASSPLADFARLLGLLTVRATLMPRDAVRLLRRLIRIDLSRSVRCGARSRRTSGTAGPGQPIPMYDRSPKNLALWRRRSTHVPRASFVLICFYKPLGMLLLHALLFLTKVLRTANGGTQYYAKRSLTTVAHACNIYSADKRGGRAPSRRGIADSNKPASLTCTS